MDKAVYIKNIIKLSNCTVEDLLNKPAGLSDDNIKQLLDPKCLGLFEFPSHLHPKLGYYIMERYDPSFKSSTYEPYRQFLEAEASSQKDC